MQNPHSDIETRYGPKSPQTLEGRQAEYRAERQWQNVIGRMRSGKYGTDGSRLTSWSVPIKIISIHHIDAVALPRAVGENIFIVCMHGENWINTPEQLRSGYTWERVKPSRPTRRAAEPDEREIGKTVTSWSHLIKTDLEQDPRLAHGATEFQKLLEGPSGCLINTKFRPGCISLCASGALDPFVPPSVAQVFQDESLIPPKISDERAREIWKTYRHHESGKPLLRREPQNTLSSRKPDEIAKRVSTW